MKDKYFQYIEYLLKTEWGTKQSLVYGLAATPIATIGVHFFFASIGIKFAPDIYLYVLMGLMLGVIGMWYMRYFRIYDPQVISLAIAIDMPPDSKRYLTEIHKQMNRHISEQGLEKYVVVKPLPSDKTFNSREKAEKFIESKGIRVLLWGDAAEETISGTKQTVFRVKTSYQSAKLNDEGKAKLQSIIEAGGRRAFWQIQSTESLVGIQVVGTNIIEITLYTLANCFLTVRQLEYVLRGIRLLEHLLTLLGHREQDANFPTLDDAISRSREILKQSYLDLSAYYWVQRHDLDQAKAYAEKLLGLDPDSFAAHINLALFAWLLGHKDDAREHTSKARTIDPKNALPMINLAFFDLMDGEYKKALAKYKLIKKFPREAYMIGIGEFLENEYEKTHNVTLRFASGWLQFYFIDHSRGRDMLREFLQLAGKRKQFAPLKAEAQKLLGSATIAP